MTWAGAFRQVQLSCCSCAANGALPAGSTWGSTRATSGGPPASWHNLSLQSTSHWCVPCCAMLCCSGRMLRHGEATQHGNAARHPPFPCCCTAAAKLVLHDRASLLQYTCRLSRTRTCCGSWSTVKRMTKSGGAACCSCRCGAEADGGWLVGWSCACCRSLPQHSCSCTVSCRCPLVLALHRRTMLLQRAAVADGAARAAPGCAGTWRLPALDPVSIRRPPGGRSHDGAAALASGMLALGCFSCCRATHPHHPTPLILPSPPSRGPPQGCPLPTAHCTPLLPTTTAHHPPCLPAQWLMGRSEHELAVVGHSSMLFFMSSAFGHAAAPTVQGELHKW